MTRNRIGQALGLAETNGWVTHTIGGREFEYRSGADGYAESLYLKEAGFGVSNPVFAVTPWSRDTVAMIRRRFEQRYGIAAPDATGAAAMGAAAQQGGA